MRAAKVDANQPAYELLTFPYPPSGNHSAKHANGRHWLQPTTIRYREDVARLVGMYKAAWNITGPVKVTYWLCPPDRRARDADNVLKSLNDALTKAGVWEDDSNKILRELRVIWGDPVKHGEVRVQIEGME